MFLRNVFLCVLLFAAFTLVYSQDNVVNTITLLPNDRVVTNMQIKSEKPGPFEPDIIKTASLVVGEPFSVYLHATNMEAYFRVTSFSTNLDFISFTRDKTRALLTFKTLSAGIATLSFQVDNDASIIRKYFYTIDITNASLPIAAGSVAISSNNQLVVVATNTAVQPKEESVIVAEPVRIPPARTPTVTNISTAGGEELALYNIANELRKSGQYDNAIDTYRNITTKFTNSPYKLQSQFRIAEIYMAQKNYTNAFNEYKTISTLDGIDNDAEALSIYSMGLAMKAEKKDADALPYFASVWHKYPKSSSAANAAYDYADSLKNMGQMSGGFDVLNAAVLTNAKFTKRGDALLLLAEMYEKGSANIRNYQKSYDTYKTYLMEFPNARPARDARDRQAFVGRNYLNIR